MLLFSALGLFWLLLHIANASLNSSYYQNSSLLNANGNSSSLANGTTLTSHAAERTLYDIWTVTSTNVDGNTDTFNELLALGLSESEIYVVGAAPGLADVNLFQVKLTEDMHSNFVPGVGASSLPLPFTFAISYTVSPRKTSTWSFQLVWRTANLSPLNPRHAQPSEKEI